MNKTLTDQAEETIALLDHLGTLALAGDNFSGRSSLLRRITGLPCDHEDDSNQHSVKSRSVYIGPEIYNSISGLGPTVREELELHAGERVQNSPINEMIEKVKLNALYGRNPFNLSGGEQALLTLTSALALNPDCLAIDCALEQIDLVNKEHLLGFLFRHPELGIRTVISDNCLEEFVDATKIQTVGMNYQFRGTDRFRPINDRVGLPVGAAKSCRISLDNIRFRYASGADVLKNVTAELEPGHLYFLEGCNGAGKTTLAKLLSGTLRPSSGVVRVDGQEERLWQRQGQIFAYHFQNPDVELFSGSVEEEIQESLGQRTLFLRLLRLSRKSQTSFRVMNSDQAERTRRCDAVIEAFGLDRVRDEHPLDLPFVMRKRVALAATVAMGCPWLVLDEPTLGQDSTSSEAIARIIEQLLTLGTGVIVISHSARLRSRLSAESLRLSEGVLYR